MIKKIVCLLCLTVFMIGVSCRDASEPSRPVIGITSVYKIDEQKNSFSTSVDFAYIEAVADNGGLPLVLPTVSDEEIIRQYIRRLDGLVLIGGYDVPPSAYNEQPHETVEVLPMQCYNFERKLISSWLKTGKPVLGICLGMQFTNVVSGGSLIQDIPSQVGTKVNHREYHRVRIAPDSSLAKILNSTEASVFSYHHQAVKDVGKNLKIIAHSDDGLIEAMERINGGFGLFVQWHPEETDSAEHRNAIFGALIKACAVRN
ncbi:MAG: gamma-glutamyl-gamma-aminobutyrate hydrolase family protein [Sedimentisphaerales bacterium]|nr:gamma-glutamyl-gamma-aminobutyrate hydrolase family protein [Sedimentisphaerales bacterium]